MRAGPADPNGLIPTPRFRAWLTTKYGTDRVRLVRVTDAERSDRFFRDYGTFTFINGVRSFVVAYPDAAAVEKDMAPIIDAEIAAADAEIAKGTPRDRIYVERSRVNVERAAYASHDAKRPIVDTTTVWRVPTGTSATLGASDALVTAVLFCAPMSPRCRWFYDRVKVMIPVRPLRLVFRPYADSGLPCDPEAVAFAMQAAIEKGPASYFTALDALEALQPKIVFATDGQRDDRAWNDAVRAGTAPSCSKEILRATAMSVGIRSRQCCSVTFAAVQSGSHSQPAKACINR